MQTVKLNCDKETALQVLREHTDTSGSVVRDAYKRFYGSFDGDTFTISLNTGSRNAFRVKAKGTVAEDAEGLCSIQFTFSQSMIMYLFLAFVLIAIISLTQVMSFFTNGAVLYAIQLLVPSVVAIFAILNYHYQVNKILGTIEKLEGLNN